MTSQKDQQLLIQAQMYQQQLQATTVQKDNLNIQMMEIKKALEALENAKTNNDVYKITGPILIKSTKSEVTKELKEKQEMIEIRGKTLEKNEEKLKSRFEEISKKLSQAITVDK